MRVLVACELSGVVRDEFLLRGHDAWSCDLEPDESGTATNRHLQCDVLMVLNLNWDLVIAHPPCTHLSASGARWWPEKIADGRQGKAVEFFKEFVNCNARRLCIENPVGCMTRLYRKPDQTIQPYEFGEDVSKLTHLWLRNLPKLVKDPEQRVTGRLVNGVERWSNQTNSGQDKTGPSAIRGKLRSITHRGVARAMADQWGRLD